MKIVFFGTPEFVVPVLKALHEKHEVVAVVTTPDSAVGRKKILTPTPVKVFAERNNIPVFQPEKLEIGNWKLEISHADFLVVAAYGQIIPQEILDIPKIAPLNIHPSLLPKYRGPSPIQTAILNGDQQTGVTIIEMDAEIDHGPIAAQEEIALSGTETFLSLADVLFRKGAEMLLDIIEKPLQPHEQDHTKATYTDHLSKEDGYIDLTFIENLSPLERENLKLEIDRMIRAYYPWPGVWIRINGKIIKLLPGKMIQMEGKNPVSIKDFLNGYPELRGVIEKLL